MYALLNAKTYHKNDESDLALLDKDGNLLVMFALEQEWSFTTII